jgi:hypothetical protein
VYLFYLFFKPIHNEIILKVKQKPEPLTFVLRHGADVVNSSFVLPFGIRAG